MDDEILENPVTGESLQVLESNAQTFKARYALRPHGEIAGEHVHPHREQLISVLAGELHVRIEGEHRIVRAGETALVPPGARHFQWNPSDVEAIVVEEIRPAGRMHDFFKVLFGLARDGKTDAQGYPPPMLAAALFSEFKDSVRPAPLGVRLMITMLRPLAQAIGQRRQFDKYVHEPRQPDAS
jgi:quercetin dioxygenase-like cupin family protein